METRTELQEPAFGPVMEQSDNKTESPAEKTDNAASETRTGGDISDTADDATRAPEEEAQSQIPGDPRPVNQLQPPTKEQY